MEEELKYTNAPKRLKPAIERLYRAETLLEDLARAVEIAEITGQWQLTQTFRSQAEEYLKDKLTPEEQDVADIKIQINDWSNVDQAKA